MNLCHICKDGVVKIIPQYSRLKRVSSDSKLWSENGEIGVCLACGIVQNITSEKWREDVGNIYIDYDIYSPLVRSQKILNKINSNINLRNQGSILEIGCGKGQFLGLFSEARPYWSLFGLEISSQHLDRLNTISGFNRLFVGGPESISQSFDLIVMIHSLEHIPSPLEYLGSIMSLLKDDGSLVIEVPDYEVNPFDLLVVDHCSHFDKQSLGSMLQRAGYSIDIITNDWVANDLSVVVKKSQQKSLTSSFVQKSYATVESQINWMLAAREMAFALSRRDSLGIFGTSIGAAWLLNELGADVKFFVDEDLNKVGSTHLGRPVYHPKDVPNGSNVFIALYPSLARLIKKRIENEYPTFQVFSTEFAEVIEKSEAII